VDKFAGYGFNKSHAAAYAVVSYHTAYLKANFREEFFAASMTLDMANTDKLNDFRRDAKKHGIEIVPPCINRSQAAFDARDGRIHYGIGAIKGVGQAVAEHNVEARGTRPFADLADFAGRVDPRVINRRTLETLIYAGALDQVAERREQAFAAIDQVIGEAQRLASNKNEGILDMFSSGAAEPIRLPEVPNWALAERLEREYAAIGFHLSGHPLDAYVDFFERLRIHLWADFEHAVKDGVRAGRLAGTVSTRQDRRTRKGNAMAVLTLSDPSGSYECVVFAEQLLQFGKILGVGNAVMLTVEADERPDGISLSLVNAQPIDGATQRLGKRLQIFPGEERCLQPIRTQLKPGGEGSVSVIVIRPDREYEIELPGGFRLSPELAGGIKSLQGVTDVRWG
jgi:DNA polymerase-3 subunit alpha